MTNIASRVLFRGQQVLTSLAITVILIPAAGLMLLLATQFVQSTSFREVEFLRALFAVIFASGSLLLYGISVKMLISVFKRPASFHG